MATYKGRIKINQALWQRGYRRAATVDSLRGEREVQRQATQAAYRFVLRFMRSFFEGWAAIGFAAQRLVKLHIDNALHGRIPIELNGVFCAVGDKVGWQWRPLGIGFHRGIWKIIKRAAGITIDQRPHDAVELTLLTGTAEGIHQLADRQHWQSWCDRNSLNIGDACSIDARTHDRPLHIAVTL